MVKKSISIPALKTEGACGHGGGGEWRRGEGRGGEEGETGAPWAHTHGHVYNEQLVGICCTAQGAQLCAPSTGGTAGPEEGNVYDYG